MKIWLYLDSKRWLLFPTVFSIGFVKNFIRIVTCSTKEYINLKTQGILKWFNGWFFKNMNYKKKICDKSCKWILAYNKKKPSYAKRNYSHGSSNFKCSLMKPFIEKKWYIYVIEKGNSNCISKIIKWFMIRFRLTYDKKDKYFLLFSRISLRELLFIEIWWMLSGLMLNVS